MSVAFACNVPLSSILEAAARSSASVFTSFYLRDVQFSSDQGLSLSPVVLRVRWYGFWLLLVFVKVFGFTVFSFF